MKANDGANRAGFHYDTCISESQHTEMQKGVDISAFCSAPLINTLLHLCISAWAYERGVAL